MSLEVSHKRKRNSILVYKNCLRMATNTHNVISFFLKKKCLINEDLNRQYNVAALTEQRCILSFIITDHDSGIWLR